MVGGETLLIITEMEPPFKVESKKLLKIKIVLSFKRSPKSLKRCHRH